MKPQNAPASIPAASAIGIATIGRLASGDTHRDRTERAQQELALRADVEQAGLEARATEGRRG